MKAIIVGSGIGGLCSALCLHKLGWEVQIYEQAPAISEVGAGIQLSPNAMHVLQYLGLLKPILAHAFRPVASQLRDGVSGQVIMSSPMGSQMERKYGAPYLHIHRADLITVLRDAITGNDPNAIWLNRRVIDYEQNEKEAGIKLDDGQIIMADIIIGADGIKSIIGKKINEGQNLNPRFTGNIAWRMTVDTEKLGRNIPPPAASVWMGTGRHAITYLLRKGKIANFVGIVECNWDVEDWNQQGSRDEILADFRGWHPIITAMIEQSTTYHKWALYDRKALPRWHDGRVTIVGDAAHAMLPFLAQGAAMAIEDAYVLAHCLRLSTCDITHALQTYFDTRIKRVSHMQDAARKHMDLFHNNSEKGQIRKYSALQIADRLTRHRAANMKMDWIYSHNVTAT